MTKMDCENCGHELSVIDIGKKKRKLLYAHAGTAVQFEKHKQGISITATNLYGFKECYCGCRRPKPKWLNSLPSLKAGVSLEAT